MARICIEYECEPQESQKRPANLLDALDQGDHRREDDDSAVGEEKVACFCETPVFCPTSLSDMELVCTKWVR